MRGAEEKEAAVLAGPPPRTPPGTIGRQGHAQPTLKVVTEMHGSARKYGFWSILQRKKLGCM
jgi:hypothetical protein